MEEYDLIPIGFFPRREEVEAILAEVRKVPVSEDIKETIVKILKSGQVVSSYRGFAMCRMCNTMLGTQDLRHGNYIFPSRWEHYVIKHDIVPIFNMNKLELSFLEYAKNMRGKI